MLNKVEETFEVFSCLNSFSASLLSCSLSAVFSLMSLFLQCFSSLCQSCMPITTKPTCAEQVVLFSGEPRRRRRGEKCEEGHGGARWGRVKHSASAAGVMLSDSAWHESWSHGGGKDREEETNSSIQFQLHVRLSNNLLLNSKYAMVLLSLALISTLFFFCKERCFCCCCYSQSKGMKQIMYGCLEKVQYSIFQLKMRCQNKHLCIVCRPVKV